MRSKFGYSDLTRPTLSINDVNKVKSKRFWHFCWKETKATWLTISIKVLASVGHVGKEMFCVYYQGRKRASPHAPIQLQIRRAAVHHTFNKSSELRCDNSDQFTYKMGQLGFMLISNGSNKKPAEKKMGHGSKVAQSVLLCFEFSKSIETILF